jgi:lysophospholipase L1-like esterase
MPGDSVSEPAVQGDGFCPPPIPIPPELEAYREQLYAPGRTTLPSPTPEGIAAAAAYKESYLEARKTDWADLCRYHADNLRLKALPQTDRQIVFMGDSITEAWSLGDRRFFQRGWINRGISGQTTPQMLVRFPADVLALAPRAVHIMGGTNDIAGNTGPTTMDMIEGNIAAMVTLARANGIRVILAAAPPADAFAWLASIEPAPIIAELNARLGKVAEREAIEFVDYGAALATSTGAMKPELTYDGVHPDAAGYAVMSPIGREAVARVLG